MNKLISQTINFLRFPLMVGVVFIHSTIDKREIQGTLIVQNTDITYKVISTLISHIISATAVPLFFLISGYLFFYNIQKFNISSYKHKVSSRIKTLLIPYIAWNFIVIMLFLFKDLCFSQYSSLQHASIFDWKINEFLLAFWAFGNDIYPISGQFWFIRDLMVVFFLLSPIIYFLTKKLNVLLPLLLAINWYFGIINYTGLSAVALFFISLGAYFGIFKIDFISSLLKKSKYIIGIYSLLALTELYLRINVDNLNIEWLHLTNILIGIMAIFCVVSRLVQKKTYAFHNILLNQHFFYMLRIW